MSDYWKQRALEQAKRRNRKIDKATRELAGYWAQTAWEIENDIAAWYTRFAKEQGMSLAEARRTLDGRSMDALKMSLEEFEAKAKENADERWEKELSAASARVHLSRLEALELQMRNKLYELYYQKFIKIAKHSIISSVSRFFTIHCSQNCSQTI